MEKELEELKDHIAKAKKSFPYFIEHIYPLSFKKNQIVRAPHTFKWAERIQNNNKTATLSARKHLKSITMYAYLMWKIFKLEDEREDWDYMSYTQSMSAYHTENIKILIQANPLFVGIKDLTTGKTQLDYTWDGKNRFSVNPTGILTFNRGRHPHGVVCDDILQDPTSELNFLIIDKVNRIFFEQVMSLPKEGGEVHVVGTAQHSEDLFKQLKNKPGWDWVEYKAIVNEADKEVLWPELFSYERLNEIRNHEIGEKAFNKEYQCSPVWSEEAYFKRPELMKAVDPELKEEKRPASEWKAGRIVAAIDIGKKSHPSHLVIFYERFGIYTMIYEQFLDGWDYTRQIEHLKNLEEFYLIDEIRYDDTRAEFEPFAEQGIIDRYVWKGVVFTAKSKFHMASNFNKILNNYDVDEDGNEVEKPRIKLLNRQRMIDSILSVNNELKAPETAAGHGDAFWSIGMALMEQEESGGYISV